MLFIQVISIFFIVSLHSTLLNASMVQRDEPYSEQQIESYPSQLHKLLGADSFKRNGVLFLISGPRRLFTRQCYRRYAITKREYSLAPDITSQFTSSLYHHTY